MDCSTVYAVEFLEYPKQFHIPPNKISHTSLPQAAAKLKAEQAANPGTEGSGSWETITEDASWETDTQASPTSATSPPSEGSPVITDRAPKVG